MTKTILALAVSTALVVPAAAQTTFYIVQDTATKRCTIVKERPTTTTMVSWEIPAKSTRPKPKRRARCAP